MSAAVCVAALLSTNLVASWEAFRAAESDPAGNANELPPMGGATAPLATAQAAAAAAVAAAAPAAPAAAALGPAATHGGGMSRRRPKSCAAAAPAAPAVSIHYRLRDRRVLLSRSVLVCSADGKETAKELQLAGCAASVSTVTRGPSLSVGI